MNDNRVDEVYNVATLEKTWYFYAACGINIRGKVIQFIEERNCDNFFYDNNQEINLYNSTQFLYNEFFVGLIICLLEKKQFDIMKINFFIGESMEKRARSIFQRLIQMKQVF